MKVVFPNRLRCHQDCELDDAVAMGWNVRRSIFAAGFHNVDSFDRLRRTITLQEVFSNTLGHRCHTWHAELRDPISRRCSCTGEREGNASGLFKPCRVGNNTHKHACTVPLRHVISFPYLGLLPRLRQSLWHMGCAPLVSTRDVPRLISSNSITPSWLPVLL